MNLPTQQTPAPGRTRLFARTAALALVCLGAILLARRPASAQVGWWSRNWQFRRSVIVNDYKRTGLDGDDVAWIDMPTAGRILPDGRDIRVTTTGRTEVPCRVLMVGPGDRVKVAFALRGTGTRYYVYFGNGKAKAPQEKLDIRRGVLQETWLYKGGGINSLRDVRKVFADATTLLGRDFRERVFVGHNPFGPQNTIASRFRAWLVAPADAEYDFACSSQDASFLVIDGKEVVANGGHHRPQRDIRKRGKKRLSKGLHELTFYHVNATHHPIAVAAWRAPGDKRIWPIPPDAFAPVFRAEPGATEQYGKSAAVDFLFGHAGEAFLRNRYYQRLRFEALTAGRLRRPDLKWDFGDGQVAATPTPEHVYFVPGEYTVTLTARTPTGELSIRQKVFVSRPWDKVTENKLDSAVQQAQIVQGYDFAALGDEANAHAILLLDRAKAAKAVRAAGEALLKRNEVPADLLEEAVPLFADDMPPDRRVEAYLRAETLTRNPRVRAEMAVAAADAALRELDDVDKAMEIYRRVVSTYGTATTAEAVREAKIGVGDVWRARGDYAKAEKAYTTAGYGPKVNVARLEITKGDYARHVEDYIRKGLLADAAEYIDRWARDIPVDKLEGYWSLLVVRYHLASKEYAAAAREAEVLVRANPRSNYAPELLLHAADAWRRLGKNTEADAALKRIVQNYPESPLAAKAAGGLK